MDLDDKTLAIIGLVVAFQQVVRGFVQHGEARRQATARARRSGMALQGLA